MNNNTKQKICPEKKEFNPNTSRCVNKCKDGFERDENFKCVKIIKPEEKAKDKAKDKTEDKAEEKTESSIYQPVDANANTPNPILNSILGISSPQPVDETNEMTEETSKNQIINTKDLLKQAEKIIQKYKQKRTNKLNNDYKEKKIKLEKLNKKLEELKDLNDMNKKLDTINEKIKTNYSLEDVIYNKNGLINKEIYNKEIYNRDFAFTNHFLIDIFSILDFNLDVNKTDKIRKILGKQAINKYRNKDEIIDGILFLQQEMFKKKMTEYKTKNDEIDETSDDDVDETSDNKTEEMTEKALKHIFKEPKNPYVSDVGKVKKGRPITRYKLRHFIIKETDQDNNALTLQDVVYDKNNKILESQYEIIDISELRKIYCILKIKSKCNSKIDTDLKKPDIINKILKLQGKTRDDGDDNDNGDDNINVIKTEKSLQPIDAVKANKMLNKKQTKFNVLNKIPLSIISKKEDDEKNELEALIKYQKQNEFLTEIEKTEYNDNNENDNYPNLYPNLNDPNFSSKISLFNEFQSTKYDGKIGPIEELANNVCNADFELMPHQMFVKNFLSENTPYNGLLLYHGVGTGKTCSAIGISEEQRKYNIQNNISQKIIIVASPNVQTSFYNQLFDEKKLKKDGEQWNLNTCVGKLLLQEINPANVNGMDKANIISLIKNLIKKHYIFMGYIEFGRYIGKRIDVSELNADEETKEILKKRRINKYFDNRLIIIDEVHNIRISDDNSNKQVAKLLTEVAKKSMNMKLLLLSATPMYNSYSEIIWIINLLNINDNRSTIKTNRVFDKDGNFIEKGDENSESGLELLQRKMIGYVSYIRGENPYAFPFRIYPETFSPEHSITNVSVPKKQFTGIVIENPMEHISVYNTNMGIFQLNAFKKMMEELPEKTNNTFKNKKIEDMENIGYTMLQKPIQATTILFPTNDDTDYGLGKEGFTSLMKFRTTTSPKPMKFDYEYKPETLKNHGRIFQIDNIKKYSGKLHSIANCIMKSTGIVMIYSQYIEGTIIPICLMLEEMGLKRFSSSKIQSNSLFKDNDIPAIDYKEMKPKNKVTDSIAFSAAKYCVITGDSHFSHNNNEDIKTIVDENNKYGELVKVVIISRAAAEGIDFKYIRQVHIVDPWFNMNRPEQIIGRAVRNRSHCLLPFKERNVEIYLHTAQDKSLKYETPDMYLYRFAENKAKLIGNVTRVMKSISVDCNLNISQTNFSIEKINAISENKNTIITLSTKGNVEYKIGDKPFTEICDYKDNCEYTCFSTKPVPDKIKYTTYNKSFALSVYSIIVNRIKQLYRSNFIYKQNDLIKEININRDYPNEQIFYVLYNIVNNKSEVIIDKYGRQGHLINKQDYYAFQPNDIVDEDISTFERSVPVDYKRSHIKMEGNIIDEVKIVKDVSKTPDFVSIMDKLQEATSLIDKPTENYIIKNTHPWYKHVTSKNFQILIMNKHGMPKNKYTTYIIHHFMDIQGHNEKVVLFNTLYYRKPFNKIEEKISEYFDKLIIDFKGKKYIVFANDKEEKHIIFNIGANNLHEASEVEYDNLKVPLFNKFAVDKKDLWQNIGYFAGFKGRGNKLKIRNIYDKSSQSKGIVCNTGLNAKDIILRLSCILNGNDCKTPLQDTFNDYNNLYKEGLYSSEFSVKNKKDSDNTNISLTLEDVLLKNGLCLLTEFTMRYLDEIKYRGKRYFFSTEEALISQISKI
jgi:hypothetical protein